MDRSNDEKNADQVNSFTFFRSYMEAMAGLSKNDRLKLLEAVCEYGLSGHEIELKGTCKALFLAFKPSLDGSRKRVICGSLGGRGKKVSLKVGLERPLKVGGFDLSSYRIGEDRIGEDICSDTQKVPKGIDAAMVDDEAQAAACAAGSGPDPVTRVEAMGRASVIGMAKGEVDKWFDYWITRSWIPNGAARPMDKRAALFSMKSWNERRREFADKGGSDMGRGDNYQAPSVHDYGV